MARIHVAIKHKYKGKIKVPGAPPFMFETTAVSDSEAVNNGIAQYAKSINWPIGRTRKYLKDYNATAEAWLLVDSTHPDAPQPQEAKKKSDHVH